MENELSDQEKSVMLAKAMGVDWRIIPLSEFDDIYADSAETVILDPDNVLIGYGTLYDPANMALAWRCHLWAWRHVDIYTRYRNWWRHHTEMSPMGKPDAQRLWLDKILELAIEAGLIEVNDEEEQND